MTQHPDGNGSGHTYRQRKRLQPNDKFVIIKQMFDNRTEVYD